MRSAYSPQKTRPHTFPGANTPALLLFPFLCHFPGFQLRPECISIAFLLLLNVNFIDLCQYLPSSQLRDKLEKDYSSRRWWEVLLDCQIGISITFKVSAGPGRWRKKAWEPGQLLPTLDEASLNSPFPSGSGLSLPLIKEAEFLN